jgi:ABC-type sugar transport system ATPase subunit
MSSVSVTNTGAAALAPASSQAAVPAIEVIGATKRFGGTQALQDVDFRVMPGEIHALVGENGSGKTTLMRIIDGLLRPDEGTIRVLGAEIAPTALAARQHGIAMVHQELSLVPTLTVAENIALQAIPTRFGFLRQGEIERTARQALARVGCELAPDSLVERLSLAERQLVEIARVVQLNPAVMMLDEPTSSLSADEVERLFVVLRRLAASGTAIVYVSHRMDELYALCESATIIRDGRLVARVQLAQTPHDELVRLMVGQQLAERTGSDTIPGDVCLTVRGLTTERLNDVTLHVRSGEVVGLAGLVGSGRTELARAIFGLDPLRQGTVAVAGREFHARSPRDAIRVGVAYVPEDRGREGLARELSLKANLAMAALPELSPAGIVRRRLVDHSAKHFVAQLDIVPPEINRQVSTLSGGNQQKVAFGKWLATQPQLMILDEPTRGIDVGAKAAIREQILTLVKHGMAVLLISSELPELFDLADRLYVMKRGRIVGEFARSAFAEQAIMRLWSAHEAD